MAAAEDHSVISSSSWDSSSSPVPHIQSNKPHVPFTPTYLMQTFNEEEIYGYVEIGKSLQVTVISIPSLITQ
jgi:hypothetical protein